MAKNPQFSTNARNKQIDALTARLNNGYLRIYSGAQPADADTAITNQVLLAELRYGSPAFAAAAAASALANAITSGTAGVTGLAAWCRRLESDGVTVVSDGTVGRNGYAADGVTPSGGAVYDVNINNPNIQVNADVLVSSDQITAPSTGT